MRQNGLTAKGLLHEGNEAMSVVEVLKRAKERIERGWCRGQFAVNAHNEPVSELSQEACRWCTSGAFYAVCNDMDERNMARDVFRKVIDDENITRWNDSPGRTKREVLAAFDKAIALATP
jgi:hypothetical protein